MCILDCSEFGNFVITLIYDITKKLLEVELNTNKTLIQNTQTEQDTSKLYPTNRLGIAELRG
jgi:hypothetical protein